MPIPAGGSGSTLPDWAPDLTRVATYIPERTVEIDRESDGMPVLSFTANTRPSAAQVQSQIEGAVAWVLLDTTSSLDSTLFDAARELAAIRAAGLAEIAWPVRDGDINAGQALLTQADAGLKSLVARNDVITGENPEVFEVAPVWSFPCPDPWGDSNYLY